MAHSASSSQPLEDLLAAVTDALLAGEDDVASITERYDVARSEAQSLISLVSRLHLALVGTQPSHGFVQHLKQDLIGAPGTGVVYRLRRLPPRVRIAAGIALVAGFMLYSRHRMVAMAAQEKQEVPVLQ